MVDAERSAARLLRLEGLVGQLQQVRDGGEARYLADEDLRAMTERRLQLAVQICIDLGAQLVSELAVGVPSDYAGVFRALSTAGVLEADLAERLSAAARQRNLLVHAYLDLDDRAVFAGLGELDDLRRFAAAVAREAGL